MAVTNVKVELKKKYNDPHKNFKEMLAEFKKRVNNAGILHIYKEHQHFESKSEKNRKRRNDAKKRFLFDSIEERVLNGEQVREPADLVKKVLASHKKEREKNDKKKKYRDRYDEQGEE